MFQHRVIAEAQLAHHAHAVRFGLDAVELNALLCFEQLDALQAAEKVEVPPGAAEFAVGHHLQTVGDLLADDVADRFIFDAGQLGFINLAGGVLLARVFDGDWTQETADGIGAKRGGLCGHLYSWHPER